MVSLAQPERGDCPAHGQWALRVVGLTSCSPAPPCTHCVTLAMSPAPSWPLYLLPNGFHHPKSTGRQAFRNVQGACEGTQGKTQEVVNKELLD